MAHYTGALLEAEIGVGPTALLGIRAVTIPEEHPAPDVTHAEETHGQNIAGGITYHNGCTLEFVDDDGEASFDALDGGTTGTLVVYPEGKTAGKRAIALDIVVVKKDRKIVYNEAVAFIVTFNATSYLEYSYVVPGAWYTGPWPGPSGYPEAEAIEADVVVYQPKWAAGTLYARGDAESYANSLLNIFDPGVHDAFSAVAPNFDADEGWSADGTQYIQTDYIAGEAGQDHSIFVAFSGATNPCELVGALTAGGITTIIGPINGSNKSVGNCATGMWTNIPGPITEGVIGFAGTRVYVNGVLVGTLPTTVNIMNVPAYIMSYNNAGAVVGYPTVTVHAVTFIAGAIAEEQAAALSWALDVIRQA